MIPDLKIKVNEEKSEDNNSDINIESHQEYGHQSSMNSIKER